MQTWQQERDARDDGEREARGYGPMRAKSVVCDCGAVVRIGDRHAPECPALQELTEQELTKSETP